MIGGSAVKTKQQRNNGRYQKGKTNGVRDLTREVRALRRLVHQPEEKNLDVNATLDPLTTGVLTLLTGISQGTDVGNRVGDVIKVTKISWMGRLALNPSVTSFSTVRMILIRDMENDGAVPSMADMLETIGGSAAVRSPINFLNRKRFSILWDQIFVLDPNTHYSEILRGEIVLNKTVRYRGTGNTVAAAAEGAMFWLTISDESANAPVMGAYTQLQFIDS